MILNSQALEKSLYNFLCYWNVLYLVYFHVF